MAEPLKPHKASDTDRLMQLSLLLKSLDDLDQEKTEYMAEHKSRKETILGEISKLRYEVLSGQERLPISITGD
jgi:predicted ribonuclease toxin of YeeF-YezG toxin-antitoxin module